MKEKRALKLKHKSHLLYFALGVPGGYQVKQTWFPPSKQIVTNAPVTAGFSPTGRKKENRKKGAINLIIDVIGKAKKSIHVYIFSFTLDSIKEALLEAKQRGVRIYIITSPPSKAYQKAALLEQLYGKVDALYIDKQGGSAHNKFAIIDRKAVLTGSTNWSLSAKANRENAVYAEEPALAKGYYEYWSKQSKHGKVLPYGDLHDK